MGQVINTEYPDLVRSLFPHYRYETAVPYRDGFFLIKNLNQTDYGRLKQFTRYIVVSKTYTGEVWDRERIIEHCKTLTKTRRKPSYEDMDDTEFEKNVKVFAVCGKWPYDVDEANIYQLYKNIDSRDALKIYLGMRNDGVPPHILLYSILTFVGKVLSSEGSNPGNVNFNYFELMRSKKRRMSNNFKEAITRFSKQVPEMDDDMKVLRLLIDLGV